MHRVRRSLVHAALILGAPMDETRVTGYMAILGGADPDDLLQSITALAKTAEFFPKPGQILEKARAIAKDRALRAIQIEEVPEYTDQERASIQETINQYWAKARKGETT